MNVVNCRHGTIGFLKTSNRINVMLSRAKHGMYILGHADTLTANTKYAMWPQVRSLDFTAHVRTPAGLTVHCCQRKPHMIATDEAAVKLGLLSCNLSGASLSQESTATVSHTQSSLF